MYPIASYYVHYTLVLNSIFTGIIAAAIIATMAAVMKHSYLQQPVKTWIPTLT